MKCPRCGEEVFDVYTTEQRIKDLYKAHNVLGWAQNRIRILAEMFEDRLKPDYYGYGEPVSNKWLAETLREIHDKMKVDVGQSHPQIEGVNG